MTNTPTNTTTPASAGPVQATGYALDPFFDETTMSLHLKEDRPILRKKGTPGNRNAVLDETVISSEALNTLIEQIFAEATNQKGNFLEIDRKLSKVLQLGPYRIVIVYPPLSDGLELTAVKPVKKTTIADYALSEETFDLLRNKSKGILVSGAPGSGKSTFVQALVEVYHQDHHIIKTIESPRDLMVDDDVVQYSFTHGTHDEVRDILLLSRPDYTIYDEVRNKPDFELYKDLRLTGIGMLGVIHATKPIDSIQRFIGSIEMGIIPQVLDTVIFIDKGQISEILQLELTAKVPEGMTSEDLSRPVIIVSSFLSKKKIYEIYTFGEQVVVMPIPEEGMAGAGGIAGKPGIHSYAKEGIEKKLSGILNSHFIVKMKGNGIELYVPEFVKGKIIGKGGSAIMELEKVVGLGITVKTFDELPLLEVKTDIS
ncbi:MAG: Flp pilus assembly complex ATPase component TadA [Candidatus Peribacteria bacterium]|jgi:ATPase|nr:Flp pilus assembly complex ATPase component TadA [Candidatus Peribacteria bacterium]